MWFRMGFNVLHSSLFADATAPKGSGDRTESRYMLLVQMLCATAEGGAFESPEYLARRFGVNKKNAKIVWDACLRNNAFDKLQDGRYTMYYWMERNGLVGRVSNTKPVVEQCSAHSSADKVSQPLGGMNDDITTRLAKVSGHG